MFNNALRMIQTDRNMSVTKNCEQEKSNIDAIVFILWIVYRWMNENNIKVANQLQTACDM